MHTTRCLCQSIVSSSVTSVAKDEFVRETYPVGSREVSARLSKLPGWDCVVWTSSIAALMDTVEPQEEAEVEGQEKQKNTNRCSMMRPETPIPKIRP